MIVEIRGIIEEERLVLRVSLAVEWTNMTGGGLAVFLLGCLRETIRTIMHLILVHLSNSTGKPGIVGHETEGDC